MDLQGKEQTIIVQTESNGVATAALLLGILGFIVTLIPYIGWFMAPVWLLAVILGLIGMRKKYKRGTAIIGLIFGILAAAYKIGFWIVAAGGIMASIYTLSGDTQETEHLSFDEAFEFEAIIQNEEYFPQISSPFVWHADNGDNDISFYVLSDSEIEAPNGLIKPKWIGISTSNKPGGQSDPILLVEKFDAGTLTFEGTIEDAPDYRSQWINQPYILEKIDSKNILLTVGNEEIKIQNVGRENN